MPTPRRRRSKYNNKRTTIDGITFHSKKEAERFCVLRQEAADGVIHSLRLQPSFTIRVNGHLICRYIADFAYTRDGVEIVEDVKSERTRKESTYRLKNKLMKAVLGIEIYEYV